jgi:hypothetical protein
MAAVLVCKLNQEAKVLPGAIDPMRKISLSNTFAT